MIAKMFDKIYEAIGWAHVDDCVDTDKGYDVRHKEIPNMLQRAIEDLELVELEKEVNKIDCKMRIYETYYNDFTRLLQTIQNEAIFAMNKLSNADDREIEMEESGKLETFNYIEEELGSILNKLKKAIDNCEKDDESKKDT